MKINGSAAFVTGANRGLGKTLTTALLERGATTVYAAVRDIDSIDDPRLTPIRVDVTDPASIEAAARRCPDTTLVINNAGVLRPGSLLGSSTLDGVRTQLETNFFGPVNVTRAFAPVLAGNGGGALVNVLSVLSWLATPRAAGYSASKAAAWSFTNSARAELRAQGTLVVGVHVAYLDTDMAAAVPGPKLAPAELARQILDAVEAGQEEVLGDATTRGVKQALAGAPALLEP